MDSRRQRSFADPGAVAALLVLGCLAIMSLAGPALAQQPPRVDETGRTREPTAPANPARAADLLGGDAAAAEGSRPVSRLSVEVTDSPRDSTPFTGIAEDLIVLKEGEPFSPGLLQKSLESLEFCNRFREVRAETREEAAGIAVRFHLVPAQRLKEVEVKGEFPFLEQEILDQIGLAAGDAFEAAELPKMEQQVRDFCGREGYPDAGVAISVRQDPDDGLHVLTVDISKGLCCRLQRLQVTGNRAFGAWRLKPQMETWRRSLLPGGAGCFTEADLNQDVKTLTRFYWSKGYPDASISPRVANSPDGQFARVVLAIEEGPRYEVSVAEDSWLWRLRLRSDLVLRRRGNRNDSGIRKSVKNMLSRCRQAGYAKAAIEVKDELEKTADGAVRRLRFVPTRGPRALVDDLRISGNHAFSDRKVRKQLLTRERGWLARGAFVPDTLEEDRLAVQTLYRKGGYLDARIEPRVTSEAAGDTERVSIGLEVEEGPRTEVSEVRVSGAEALSAGEVEDALSLKAGQPYQAFLLPIDENSLGALISEKGYPRVKVTGEPAISEDRLRAGVHFQVEQGPRVEMGNVYCAGAQKTRERVLTRELKMTPGDPFSLRKMLEGQRNIRDLEVLKGVRFRTVGLEEGSDRVTLFIDVEENKPYYLEAGGGYETQRGLFGNAKAGDHNVFGLNKDVWLGGEASQIGYRGEGGVTDPRFLGTRVSATLKPFVERKAEFNQRYGTRTYGSSLTLARKWQREIGCGLELTYERRDLFAQNGDGTVLLLTEAVDIEDEPRNVLVVTPSITYDGRDSFVRPRKGIYSTLAVDVTRGLGASLDSFLKYRLDVRFYWSPLSRLTFAWHGKAGYIDPFGSVDTVPYDQLFFLGGTLDIRGFRENLLLQDQQAKAVGGRTALLGSMEARIELAYNFEVATFFDAGWLGDTYSAAARGRLGLSTGLGLRYNTPIGPIGVLYGINLDRRTGEDFGRVHFAIGYTF